MTRFVSRVVVAMMAVAVLSAAWCETAQGTTMIRRSTEELTILSDLVVEGVVADVESRWHQDHKFVYTYVTLSLDTLYKGSVDGETIVLEELGGTANDVYVEVSCTPEFEIGERVIVFVEVKNDYYYRAHGMCQGKFAITVDYETGEEIVIRQDGVDASFNADHDGQLDSTVDAESGKRFYGTFVQTIRDNADIDELPGGVR